MNQYRLPAVFCSHNPDKIREISDLMPGWNLTMLPSSAPEPVEDGETYTDNARIKAVAGAALYPGQWVIADDSGISVDALDGEPGVMSARWSGHGPDANNQLLLQKLTDCTTPESRRAHFICVLVAITPTGREVVARGEVHGHIAFAVSEVPGFAYDRLFIPDGHDQTFAELGNTIKSSLSHRARACRRLTELVGRW